jgi:predicted NAD/FAD-binding protein
MGDNLNIMRFAVVGGGVSGMVTAYLLSKRFEVTLYEAADELGGHTHTVEVDSADGVVPVDMGFIVFNEENYPGFVRLLDQLGVGSKPSDMSFGVSSERTGVEYGASSLGALFAQKQNLVSSAFHRMLWDVSRFRKRARALVQNGNGYNPSLADYLRDGNYSERFIEEFIVPMGAAIWSADPRRMAEFPARSFVRFFENHRFLDTVGQPVWRTVEGGSRRYVDRIAKHLGERLRLRSTVREIRRFATHVQVATDDDATLFDHVIIVAHSDQALRMLREPTRVEEEVLGAIDFQGNDTVLHTDASVMPRSKRAWASWNVHVPAEPATGVNVTYHSNRLQSLDTADDFFVTLNRTEEIRAERVIQRMDFAHPIYTLEGLKARDRRDEINGHNRTSYCGAYWGDGFHEDGVQSALAATAPFGVAL